MIDGISWEVTLTDFHLATRVGRVAMAATVDTVAFVTATTEQPDDGDVIPDVENDPVPEEVNR